MKEKDKLYDELREHSPALADLKGRQDGLKVPEGYFEQLETEVFRQLDALGARRRPAPFVRPERGLSVWQFLQKIWHPRTALAFAGSAVLLLGAWWLLRPAPEAPLVADISVEDAEAYLLENAHELEPEQIASILPLPEGLPLLDDAGPAATGAKKDLQISPDELEDLLENMSDEELEDLL